MFQSRPQNSPQEEAKRKTLKWNSRRVQVTNHRASYPRLQKNPAGETPPHSSMTTALPPSFHSRVKCFWCPMNKDTVALAPNDNPMPPRPASLPVHASSRPNGRTVPAPLNLYSSPISFISRKYLLCAIMLSRPLQPRTGSPFDRKSFLASHLDSQPQKSSEARKNGRWKALGRARTWLREEKGVAG